VLSHSSATPHSVTRPGEISTGDLPASDELSLTYIDKEKLVFQWNPGDLEGTNRKDQIIVLAYHPESRTVLQDHYGSFRESGVQELKMIKDFYGKTIHVYAAFVSVDRKSQSDSVYLGAVDC
jgi:hypothetical protein